MVILRLQAGQEMGSGVSPGRRTDRISKGGNIRNPLAAITTCL